MPHPPTSAPPDERADDEIPRTGQSGFRCGEYVLEQFMDFGGFSEVWAARHEITNHLAAVKLLRPQQQHSAEARERFEREVMLIAKIKHENVVGFLGAGFCVGPNGARLLWLAMDLLDGASLRTRLHRGERFDEENAVRIGFEICCGVSEAHEMGVVHRDLKPENVFVTLADVVKILDFGIAKFSATWGFASTGRMRGVLGTPSYMSPEQIGGGVPSSPSDVYQIGLIVYELCAGRHPFGYANGEMPTQVQLCELQSTFAPLPLTEIGIEPEIWQVIEKALSKKPEDRYSTARELGQAFWSALTALRKGRAACDLPADEVNPGSSASGEPLGAHARRAYQPAVTPPRDAPPPMPSKTVKVRSDLTAAPPKPPPLPMWTGEGRPANGPLRTRWEVTEQMTGTEAPLPLRVSDAPAPRGAPPLACAETTTLPQPRAVTPEPLVLGPVTAQARDAATQRSGRPAVRESSARSRWTVPAVVLLFAGPLLAGWYRQTERTLPLHVTVPALVPTGEPVAAPALAPTDEPVAAPASEPTGEPVAPASEPTGEPVAPASEPTGEPVAPASEPTSAPRTTRPRAIVPPSPPSQPSASAAVAPPVATATETNRAPHRLFGTDGDEPGGAR